MIAKRKCARSGNCKAQDGARQAVFINPLPIIAQ